jgi:membrane-associated protein
VGVITPDLGRFQGNFGILIYPLIIGLFLFQTGFLVGFAIPGNPLLLSAGLMSSPNLARLNLPLVIGCAGLGAFAGNLLNYHQGKLVLPFLDQHPGWKQATEKFQAAFGRHGSRIVVAAAFVPILRAVVPFLAGVGQVPYRSFVIGSLIGTFAWVGLWATIGSQLATMLDGARNANWIMLGIVGLVVISIAVQTLVGRMGSKGR